MVLLGGRVTDDPESPRLATPAVAARLGRQEEISKEPEDRIKDK